MLENHKCHHPARPQGSRGGKQKADAVKLVVCIGGGDHLQAINQQTKTSLNRLLENHKCQHRTGPQGGREGKTEVQSVCALVGDDGVSGGGGGRG